MRALLEVRSRHNFERLIKTTPLLARSIGAAAYPYHSIPADDCRLYPDGISDDSGNGGYSDWTRSRGDEFAGFRHTRFTHGNDDLTHWRNYVQDCRLGRGRWTERYPILGNELCPHCREAFYWGSDAYVPHWVHGDAIWNQRSLDVYGFGVSEWNVQPQMAVDYYGNVVGGWAYGENFNLEFHPHRRGIGYFNEDGGREFQVSEQPVSPNWRNGKYPQTLDTYYSEPDGRPLSSSRAHGSNFDLHWNDTIARRNQESRYFYDQNTRPHSTADYNHNLVMDSSRFERLDASFHRQEHNNRSYDNKYAHGQSLQNSSSIPNVNGGVPQGNGYRQLNVTHRGSQQSWDRHERGNRSNQPQSYVIEYPNRSYSENNTGFQRTHTDSRSNSNRCPEAAGQRYAHYNDFRNGRVLNRPEVKNSSNVDVNYKENRDGSRWSDVKDRSQSLPVKEQPAKMANKRGKPYESLEAYLQSSNEAAKHSQQQQPQATSTRYTQKTDGNQHQVQQQSSDSDFLGGKEPTPSATLNSASSAGGSKVINSGIPIENLEPEQIRGTVEELEAFTREGKLMLAVKVLDAMERKKYSLDPERDLSTLKMLIRACVGSKAVTEARAVHKHIANLMSPLKFSIYNKILGMYLNCGAVADACSMFYKMAAHNLTSWDTMIKGLVKNNLGEEALDVFAEFKNTDSEPDGPMFLGVFSACRLVGDVVEGMLHFESMSKQYGITPSMKHYISIVDMIGHAGHLDEAMEFIEKMPVKPSVGVWEAMMNVCRIHGNTELGDRCAEMVHKLDPTRLSDESKAGLIPLVVSNHGEDEK